MAVHDNNDFHTSERFFPLPSEFEDTTYTTPPSPLFDITIPRPTSAPDPRAREPHKRARTPSNGKYDSDGYASILSSLARHSRKRSASRASETGSVAALLVITNERLTQETARANALQVQNTSLEGVIRTHATTIAQLRQELLAVREELRLYKLQLETANREIARAQNVCDSVERARVDAEDRARRDRDRVRRYAEQIEVQRARDDGYEHGLREGMTRAAGMSSWRRFVPRRGYTDPAGTAYRETAYEAPGSVTSSDSPSRPPSRSGRKSIAPSDIVSPTPLRPVQVPPPRVPSSAGTVRPPSRPRSQSNPVSRQENRPPTRQEGRPPTRQGSAKPVQQPEDINIYPVPYIPSPTPSKRSIILPPDNFIPVFDEESQSIRLPPPHELAAPNPVDDAEEEVIYSPRGQPAQPEDYFTHEPRRSHRRVDSEPPRPYAPYAHSNAQPRSHAFPMRTRTMSDASTTISHYDLLRHGEGRSPIPPPAPPEKERPTPEEQRRRRSNEVVQDWQAHNEDDAQAGMGADLRRGNPPPPQMPVPNERPRQASFSHQQRPQSGMSQQQRPPSVMSGRSGPPSSGGPRTKPRRIVLPQPLTAYSSSAPYVPTLKSQNLPPAPPAMPAPPTAYQQPPPAMLAPSRSRDQPPSASSGSAQSHSKRASGLGGWIRGRFQRSSTSSTIPQIAIEPPSVPATSSSGSTVRDELLLSPDLSPSMSVALPDEPREVAPEVQGPPRSVSQGPPRSVSQGAPRSMPQGAPHSMSQGPPQSPMGSPLRSTTPVIELPGDQLPWGFMPTSPLMPVGR